MKPYCLLIPFIITLIVGCEKEDSAVTNGLTDGFCIQINDDHIINHYDIEYYDFSTHIVYLKSADKLLHQTGMDISFKVFAGFEEIYQGSTLPLYSCFIISGPTINQFYPDFVIALVNNVIPDSTGMTPTDPREDERIIQALIKYNQFHPGLKCTIDTIITSPTGLILEISLINDDSFDYYILSPDNMGIRLFHYFTSGLRISDDVNHESYRHHIETLQPDPYDNWKKEWFYLIRSKGIKTFTLFYSQFDVIPPGQYNARFRFPGLHYLVNDKEDLIGDNGRIWLGEIDVKKQVTFK
jgi:hypothetical protein